MTFPKLVVEQDDTWFVVLLARRLGMDIGNWYSTVNPEHPVLESAKLYLKGCGMEVEIK